MPAAAPTLADGRYRLVEILGEGGMAVVYRAWDERLQVERAIKLLAPQVARQADLRERFENEARTMASLSHRNIISVHDIGQDGDEIYMVMELVEGGTLWDWVSCYGEMPPGLALQAIRPVLGAMGAAHLAGVIHRDLKPQNIMLTTEGQPKVSDFGIAHVQDPLANRHLTRTGTVMGTWGYMAPEQRHSARQVDGRSDIYAIGATLYAVTSGQVPVDLFAADEDGELLGDMASALAEVIRRATRYKPEARYQDVEQMRRALDEAARELPGVDEDVAPLGTLPEGTRSEAHSTFDLRAPWTRSEGPVIGGFGRPERTSSDTFDISADSKSWPGGEERSGASLSEPGRPAQAPASSGASSLPAGQTEAPQRSRLRLLALAGGLTVALLSAGWLGWQRWGGSGASSELTPAQPAVAGGPGGSPAERSAPQDEGSSVPPAQEEPAGSGELEEGGADGTVQEAAASPEEPGSSQGADPQSGEPPQVVPAKEATSPGPPAGAGGAEPPAGSAEPVSAPAGESKAPVLAEPSAPEEPPAEPQPLPTGTVSFTGEAEQVILVDGAGEQHAPGSLPVGSYVIKALFPGRDALVVAGKLTVEAGRSVTMSCGAVFQKCQ